MHKYAFSTDHFGAYVNNRLEKEGMGVGRSHGRLLKYCVTYRGKEEFKICKDDWMGGN